MFGEKLMDLLKNYSGTMKLATAAEGVNSNFTFNIECGLAGWGWGSSSDSDSSSESDSSSDDDYRETEGYYTTGADE